MRPPERKVLLSFDELPDYVERLQDIARRAYGLKGTTPSDDELRQVAWLVDPRNERTVHYRRVPLPRSFAPSRSRATTPCTPAPAGYDAGKKINGRRKRHIAVDSTGLPLVIVVTAASIQDRGGVLLLLAALRAGFSTAMTATMTQRLASTMTSSQTRSESKEVSLQDW